MNDVIALLGTFQQNMLEKIEGLRQGISNLAFDLHNEHVAWIEQGKRFSFDGKVRKFFLKLTEQQCLAAIWM